LAERRLRFAVPGDLDQPTGGYRYDKRLIAELDALGWTVTHLPWPGSFPLPTAADLRMAAADLAACPAGAVALIDGLAFGVMPDILAKEAGRLRLAALVHHPLALESGLRPEERERLADLERRALGAARAVIVTSHATAATLAADYAVEPGRITVAEPGVDRPPRARPAHRRSGSIRLLAVGSIVPRKGLDVLVDALSRIPDLAWTCAIAGSLTRAPETAAALGEQIRRLGLDPRITLMGEVDDPTPLYNDADVFVLPSRYEGYGMVFAEAMAHGLPIVATNAGAIPEVVPPSAGILVPVDDAEALAVALGRVIVDADTRSRFAAGAQEAAMDLSSWPETAARVASALGRIDGRLILAHRD
jgi:glycosyltransferase involved in cell wall biosynthesis